QSFSDLQAPAKPENVRAVLKNDQWLAEVAADVARSPKEKIEENGVVARPFAGNISVVYMLDFPKGMSTISRGKMRELHLNEAQLHELAIANLEKALTTMPHRQFPSADGKHAKNVWIVEAGDDYEASRLLVRDFWVAQAKRTRGKL